LGQQAPLFCEGYNVLEQGNCPDEGDPAGEFHGQNVLYRSKDDQSLAHRYEMTPGEVNACLAEARQKLVEARSLRPRPHRDEKVIVAWNGLIISALARCGATLGNHAFVRRAQNAAEFIWEQLFDGTTLRRHWKEGASDVRAFADDYAALARAFVDLYEATFLEIWLQRAIVLMEALHRNFWDESGGYFNSAPQEDILVRFKEDYDGAEPSANSLAAWTWVKLHHLTAHPGAKGRAEALFAAFADRLGAIPSSMPLLLRAKMMLDAPPVHLVLCGDPEDEDTLALLAPARESFLPFLNLIALGNGQGGEVWRDQPFLAAMTPGENGPRAYLCSDFSCALPTSDVEELRRALKGTAGG
jgi:uncharacterized protein YyaL (SSP411 family)